MRYLLFGIVFLGWLLFCTWLYGCHLKQTCCPADTTEIVQTPKTNSASNEIRPLLFTWSSEQLSPNESQDGFVDSLLGLVQNQDQLEITGRYYRDEVNNSDFDNLGLARAEAMKSLVSKKLDTARIITQSQIAELTGDVRNSKFNALDFKVKMNNDFIKEVGNGTLIYFPPNSTKKLDNATIDKYLADVADRLKQTTEKVILTGHTDAIGPARPNYELAYFRAGAIKDILLEKGLSDERVIVKSEGEKKPIESNKTNQGRRMNRRVELTIQ